MKKKQLVSLAMSLVLAGGLLAGCGASKEVSSGETKGEAKEVTQESRRSYDMAKMVLSRRKLLVFN